MKICKSCGEVSSDDSPVCQNPNCYGNKFDNYEQVKNIDENHMSDMYDTYFKIVGIACVLISIVLLVKPLFCI